MNDLIEFPCKCGHMYEVHDIYEEDHGGYVYLEDIKEEVWDENIEEVPVCNGCSNYCNFESMNNLEYLEWKHEQNR